MMSVGDPAERSGDAEIRVVLDRVCKSFALLAEAIGFRPCKTPRYPSGAENFLPCLGHQDAEKPPCCDLWTA